VCGIFFREFRQRFVCANFVPSRSAAKCRRKLLLSMLVIGLVFARQLSYNPAPLGTLAFLSLFAKKISMTHCLTSRWLLALAVVLLCNPDGARAQQSVNPQGNQGRQVSLRDQLTAGLKAKTKGDFTFIDKVIANVEQGKLPRRMVDGTFLWARNRAAAKSYARSLRPMVYFQPGLTARAKRIGVTL
jgi:hypothetical protein